MAYSVEDSITRIIAAIYAAAVAPDQWTDVLTHLRNMFGLSFAASVVRNADRSRVDGVAVGVDRDDYRTFLDKYYRGSIFLAQGQSWHAGQIIRSAQIVPQRVFHRTDMYQEYWRPRDLHEGLRLAIARDESGVHHSVNLIRPPSGNTFDAADIALARLLMPHLRTASELGRRLRHADMLASAALATLDVLRHPVLLLDQHGHVLHANAAGDAMLAAADGLGASNGILHATAHALTNRLREVLARAAGTGGVPPRAGAVRLRKRSGGSALAVLALPFRHEVHWSLPRRPAILVCVTDPDAIASLPGRQMIELFGLTGSEAALAADLLAGKELRDIATERGRSINTVRKQLAGLMAKTDVNRQSELVRLLASLPQGRDQL